MSNLRPFRDHLVDTAIRWVLVLAATAFVSTKGVPVLRHDWPAARCGLSFVVDALSGWDSSGLGAPIGYPSSFLVWPVRGIAGALFGTFAAHVLFFLGCNALIAYGAVTLCKNLGGTRVAAIAVCAFALFNPWLYVELVAGHAYAVLGFGALLSAAAEASSSAPNTARLILIALALAPQIQFLVLGVPLYAGLSLRMRDWRPIAAIALFFVPVITGITTTRESLLATPFTLAWEASQSLQPQAAALMSGYFTRYDARIESVAGYAMLCLVALAAFGAVGGAVRYRAMTAAYVAAALLALILATGIHGAAVPFVWTVTHIPEFALFRELYVLVAVLGVAYAALLSIASRLFAPLGYVMLAAAIVLPLSWCIQPPMSFAVADGAIPHAKIHARPNSRFLLLPAVEPIRFAGAGSGSDPDLCPSSGGATPINDYTIRYPISSAIGRFYRDGSLRDFAALGVERVYDRPSLETDRSIYAQLAFPSLRSFLEHRSPNAEHLNAASLVALSPLPKVGSLVNVAGAGNVLEGDASAVRGDGVPQTWAAYPASREIKASNRFVNASVGWVDARFGFLEEPDIAQPFGGALTTNPSDVLPIDAGRFVLAYIRGTLTDEQGAKLSDSTGGYRWLRLPAGIRGVRCSGLCAIAAERDAAPAVPLNPAAGARTDLTFARPIPWLVTTSALATSTSLLRYEVSFDGLWLAFDTGRLLPHVRIDGTVNGWILPASAAIQNVTLIEAGAFAVSVSELLAAAGLATLLFATSRSSPKRYRP